MKLGKRFLNALDRIDNAMCEQGLLRAATFDDVLSQSKRALYAGKNSRFLPQFKTHFGLTPSFKSSRNILFDVTDPFPLPDNSIDVFQSEDVFEHIEYGKLTAVFDEIHRILKPGGLFRLSLPDYRFDGYFDRSVTSDDGDILFDPGGGGAFEDGHVTEGGHLWFPMYELVDKLFRASAFGSDGSVNFLHYTSPTGDFVLHPIDYTRGHVLRVPDHDLRAKAMPRPISIVVDAVKSGG